MKSGCFGLFLVLASLAPAQQGTGATYRGGLVTPPLPKPSFTLSTTSGDKFDFRSKTDGYVTLLFFGYTNCPDVCPMHMSNIGTALRKMPANLADQVKLVFVTTDPARDSREVLRSWLDHFDKRFIGLTGTARNTAAIVRVAFFHRGDECVALGLHSQRRWEALPGSGDPRYEQRCVA